MNSRNTAEAKRLAEKYLNFLVNEFGCGEPTEQWASYEFHFRYSKTPIEVDIVCDADGTSIATVLVKDDRLPVNAGYILVESLEQNTTIQQIHHARNTRYKPMVDRFVHK